jgi:hypothetical protein
MHGVKVKIENRIVCAGFPRILTTVPPPSRFPSNGIFFGFTPNATGIYHPRFFSKMNRCYIYISASIISF